MSDLTDVSSNALKRETILSVQHMWLFIVSTKEQILQKVHKQL